MDGQDTHGFIYDRCKCLRPLHSIYRFLSRRQHTEVLDEIERVTGQHHKSVIRLLRSNFERKPCARQRGCSYVPPGRIRQRLVARILGFPCLERL
jgi:hypothetical protein